MIVKVEQTRGVFLRVEVKGKYDNLNILKEEIRDELLPTLDPQDFYLETSDGKLLRGHEEVETLLAKDVNTIHVLIRVLGGKGGFGSMLRAIGAQIEKTTNRDACRDLSGRRLRDINEEQRLKKWFARQAEREKEKQEAKKRKLDKLRHIADGPPLPKIDDQEFLQQREDIVDAVFEAVDEAFRDGTQDVDAVAAHNDSSNSSSSNLDVALSGKEVKPCATSDTAEPVASGSGSASVASGSGAASSVAKQERKPMKKTMFDEDFDTTDTSSDEEEEPLPKKSKLP